MGGGSSAHAHSQCLGGVMFSQRACSWLVSWHHGDPGPRAAPAWTAQHLDNSWVEGHQFILTFACFPAPPFLLFVAILEILGPGYRSYHLFFFFKCKTTLSIIQFGALHLSLDTDLQAVGTELAHQLPRLSPSPWQVTYLYFVFLHSQRTLSRTLSRTNPWCFLFSALVYLKNPLCWVAPEDNLAR